MTRHHSMLNMSKSYPTENSSHESSVKQRPHSMCEISGPHTLERYPSDKLSTHSEQVDGREMYPQSELYSSFKQEPHYSQNNDFPEQSLHLDEFSNQESMIGNNYDGPDAPYDMMNSHANDHLLAESNQMDDNTKRFYGLY